MRTGQTTLLEQVVRSRSPGCLLHRGRRSGPGDQADYSLGVDVSIWEGNAGPLEARRKNHEGQIEDLRGCRGAIYPIGIVGAAGVA